MTEAFNAGREAVDWDVVAAAIDVNDAAAAFEAVIPSSHAIAKSLERSELEDYLAEVMEDGFIIAAEELDSTLRASAGQEVKEITIQGVTFSVKNIAATEWLRAHVGELIKTLPQTTLDEVREVIVQVYEEKKSVEVMTREIAASIGDRKRARLIARTETLRAANEGQKKMWQEAKSVGLLDSSDLQVWLVSADEKLCKKCEPYDGVTAPIGEEFDEGGPPLHPNCRCTVGLQ